MLLVDNLMDMTHLAYVHKSTIGGSNPKALVEAKTNVTPNPTGLHYIRWMQDFPPPPTYKRASPSLGERVDRWQEFEYIAPGNIIQWSGALDTGKNAMDNRDQPGGFSLRLFHGLTPETDGTCFYFWSTANGYRQDEPQATLDLFNEISIAFNEDKQIVEAQQKTLEATGETGLVDIVSDAARVHMRRAVNRIITEERAAAEAPQVKETA
jgi:vanillate O-demethylase monooxygenase subunit